MSAPRLHRAAAVRIPAASAGRTAAVAAAIAAMATEPATVDPSPGSEGTGTPPVPRTRGRPKGSVNGCGPWSGRTGQATTPAWRRPAVGQDHRRGGPGGLRRASSVPRRGASAGGHGGAVLHRGVGAGHRRPDRRLRAGRGAGRRRRERRRNGKWRVCDRTTAARSRRSPVCGRSCAPPSAAWWDRPWRRPSRRHPAPAPVPRDREAGAPAARWCVR